MYNIFRVVLGTLCLVAVSPAAAISFNATITDSVGVYAPTLPVVSSITGTVDITSASADADADPLRGSYSLAVGSIQLFLNGNPFAVLEGGTFVDLSVLVEDSIEAQDTVTFFADPVIFATNEMTQGAAKTFNVSGFLTLVGDSNFLVNGDSLPTGPSSFNWSQFLSGYGQFGDVSMPVFEGGIPVNGFAFVVDTAVPEPGTVFGVAAGGLVLFLKRRQSR